MVMRFLYWFYFKTTYFGDIPEFHRLPYEERMRVVIAAQEAEREAAQHINITRDVVRTIVILVLGIGSAVILGRLGHKLLAVLLAAAIGGLVVACGPSRATTLGPHIRRILAEKAKAKAAARA